MGKFEKVVLSVGVWTVCGFVAFCVGFALGNTTQELVRAINRA